MNVEETRQIDEEEFDGTEQDRKGEDIDFCEGDLGTMLLPAGAFPSP